MLNGFLDWEQSESAFSSGVVCSFNFFHNLTREQQLLNTCEKHVLDDVLKLQNLMYQIGAFAAPDKIHWAPALPKTRSGKIMRRILRKIASRQLDELGDISTLAEPGVVDQLISLADC